MQMYRTIQKKRMIKHLHIIGKEILTKKLALKDVENYINIGININ